MKNKYPGICIYCKHPVLISQGELLPVAGVSGFLKYGVKHSGCGSHNQTNITESYEEK